jgi:hypothetical protein
MNDQIFKKVEKIAYDVKRDLRNKGFVIPRDNGDGTITVDNFTIVREPSGFYTIRDRHNDVIVDYINLAQTAAVLANKLALGQLVDTDLVNVDRYYGYNLFKELVAKRNAEASLRKADVDRADFMYTKLKIAKNKKLSAKATIINSFEKLRRLR